MKRWCRFLALSAALALLCCSCTHELSTLIPQNETTASYDTFSTTQAPVADDTDAIDPPLPLVNIKDNRYCYEALTVEEQLYYEQVLDELYRYSGMQTILEDNRPGIRIYLRNAKGVEPDTLFRAVDALYDDHPELFYLHFDYLVMTDDAYAFVEIPYIMDLEEREKAADSLRGYVIRTAASVAARDEYHKALYVHDQLLIECDYNHTAADNMDDRVLYSQNSSAYYALIRDEAICGGYTRAMQLLLTFFGIPNTVVSNTDHIWNLVWFDGEPYHVDATWDDIDGIFCHTYFGVTTEELRKTREIPAQTRPLPAVTATAGNYYHNTGRYFESVYDEAFLESFGYQVENNAARYHYSGGYFAEIRFDPEGYAQALRSINSGEFCDLLSYFLTDDNDENDYIYRRMQQLGYYKYDDLHVIVFCEYDEPE